MFLFLREEKLNVCYGQISLKFDVCSYIRLWDLAGGPIDLYLMI
jgi:hypothetical protein